MNNKYYFLYTLVILVICLIIPDTAIGQDRAYTGGLYSSLSTLPYTGSIYQQQSTKKPGWKIIGKITKPSNSDNYINKPYHNPNLIKEQKRKQELARAQQLQNQKIKNEAYQKKLQNMCINSLESRRINRRGYKTLNQKVTSRTVVPFKDYKNACDGFIKDNRLISSNN